MADGQTPRVSSGFGQVLDHITLEHARRGDMAAFAAIYQRFGSACYNLALRVLGERAAAEDIVQEIFVKLFDGLDGFRGDAPFGAWLKRMTANATIDVLRRQQRFGDDDAESLFESRPTANADVETGVDLWSLLMRLPARARAVVVLHEIEGYTHREIAGLFGQSESYSKSILARALQRLGDTTALVDGKETCGNA